ncbi:MAG TPA: LemA family protein [Polyangiales bacterium]|nr:LemA family protein [Polyangiales bacterium]
MAILIGLIAVLVLIVLALVSVYNGLVGKRNRYKNAYAQIDVQLKRRYDLIPNLVETVKGYMKHESATLEAVIRARNSAYGAAQSAAQRPGDPNALQALASAEGALAQGLSKIIALSESYPDLKANGNMAQLTEELTSTENKVAFARQAYNDAATEYNSAREMFPAVMFAAGMGFGPAGLLESIEAPEERRAPKVSFT